MLPHFIAIEPFNTCAMPAEPDLQERGDRSLACPRHSGQPQRECLAFIGHISSSLPRLVILTETHFNHCYNPWLAHQTAASSRWLRAPVDGSAIHSGRVTLQWNDDQGDGLRMRLDSIFPASLPRLRRRRFTGVVELVVVEKIVHVEGAPVQQLEPHEVQVDGMQIPGKG